VTARDDTERVGDKDGPVSFDPAAERLRRASAAAALPSAVATGQVPEPAAEQLWRARWERLATLLVILRTTDEAVEVAPAAPDVNYADDQALVIPANNVPVRRDLVVWLGLARPVPVRVLDTCFGSLTGDWRALAVRGIRIASAADPRAEYRAHLADTLGQLAETSAWVTVGAGTLANDLRRAGVTPTDLVTRLSVTPQAALAVLRGNAPVTAAQAAELAALLDRSAVDVLAANPAPDRGVVMAIDRPRFKRRVLHLAAQQRTSEREARLTAAYGAAFAARQNQLSAAVDWAERLDRYFAAVLHDE
jgi:hypothetical protein